MNSKLKVFFEDRGTGITKSSTSQTPQNSRGLIFDIQKFVLHDGHGIRTLVFMKGCPLRCRWCSNPESQETYPEIILHPEKCLNCHECVKICRFKETLTNEIPEDCNGCGDCTDVCYPHARQRIGTWMEKSHLLELVKKDIIYFQQSNGGVTVGGGEPTMQSEFLVEFLGECKTNGINTAIETCGYTSWEKMRSILYYTDLLLFDIKHVSSKKHKEFTGVGNELIISNAIRASNYVKEMIVRLPLIPDFNNSDEDLNLIGKFIHESLPNVKRVDILPYHSMGESKSVKLGKKYSLHGLRTLNKEEVENAKNILQSYALEVVVMN